MPPTPQPATDARFLALATPLVLFVGTIHLLQGLAALAAPTTPYPPALLIAFLALGVSAIAIGVGIETALLPPRVAYSLGVALMALSFAAYADVHAVGALDAAFATDLAPAYGTTPGSGTFSSGPVSPVIILSAHLMSDPVALLTKITEFVTMNLLSIAALRHGVDLE